MKRLILAILFFGIAGKLHAISQDEFNYIPITSYTEASTPGTILFTSASVNFVGVTIASPSANAYIAIFRSTSPTFTADIATQTIIGADYQSINTGGDFIPLMEMQNDSYTYINKSGPSKMTIWIRCRKRSITSPGVCPGLPSSGQINGKIGP